MDADDDDILIKMFTLPCSVTKGFSSFRVLNVLLNAIVSWRAAVKSREEQKQEAEA
jgi:hypothetical protein